MTAVRWAITNRVGIEVLAKILERYEGEFQY